MDKNASSDTGESSSSADSSSEEANDDTAAPTTSSALHELDVEDFAKMDDEIEEALGVCVCYCNVSQKVSCSRRIVV